MLTYLLADMPVLQWPGSSLTYSRMADPESPLLAKSLAPWQLDLDRLCWIWKVWLPWPLQSMQCHCRYLPITKPQDDDLREFEDKWAFFHFQNGLLYIHTTIIPYYTTTLLMPSSDIIIIRYENYDEMLLLFRHFYLLYLLIQNKPYDLIL